ncbi:hypothetical protein ScPMuIL_014559 [Solemya velum]
MKRIGYLISEKKSKKLNFEEHSFLFRNAGIELVKIDIDSPLEEQGPFHMILHKLADIMVKAEEGFTTAQKHIHNVQDYHTRHPECIIVDPLENMNKLLDRNSQYKVINLVGTDTPVFAPAFVELSTAETELNKKKLKQFNVNFPIVCKPIVAHGSRLCHQMSIIFNEEGLGDISPPCVAQTFINHSAVLYKVFVIGSKHFVVQRPSLRDMFPGDHKTIFFDSQDVSKADSSNFLNEMDTDEVSKPSEPDTKRMGEFCQAIRQAFGLDLIGVDVIVESGTGKYAVIDVNAFPGYDGVDNFFQVLCDYLLTLLNQQQEHRSTHPILQEYGKAKQDGRSTQQENGKDGSHQRDQENIIRPKRLKADIPNSQSALPFEQSPIGMKSKCSTYSKCDTSDSSENENVDLTELSKCKYSLKKGHVISIDKRQET